MTDREQGTAGAWWVIHEDDLLRYLERARAGEDPGLIVAEAYANVDHETVDPPE